MSRGTLAATPGNTTLKTLHLCDKGEVQMYRKQKSIPGKWKGHAKVLECRQVQHSGNGELWVLEVEEWVQS